MIFLVHEKGKTVKNLFLDSEKIEFRGNICNVFWKAAAQFADEIIVWVEEGLFEQLNIEEISSLVNRDFIMASYAVKTKFLSDSIGFVDQLPFINVNRKLRYPTWQMSTDVGAVKAATLIQFKNLFQNISDFGYLLNSIGKVGQQNGLFCYSDPTLIKNTGSTAPIATAGNSQLFSFVFQHYNTPWTFVLLWCFRKYKREIPLFAFKKAFFRRKFFQKKTELVFDESPHFPVEKSIDVIVPTLGRKEYLIKFLKDLKAQTLKPRRVIVVEQNPDRSSESELYEILSAEWPFQVIHHFIHRTGACNARNIAIEEVKSEWVFLADDDISIAPKLLENTLGEIERLGVSCLNLNCKQEGQATVFPHIKQWGSFGSGTSIVKSEFVKRCRFSPIYENGFGEDMDFGIQLRNAGCDVIYHPNLKILHFKAARGGLRTAIEQSWHNEKPHPKPSPTLMAFSLQYFTFEELMGFKTSLFLKFYRHQSIKNPLEYRRKMEERWKVSEKWAKDLIGRSNSWDSKKCS